MIIKTPYLLFLGDARDQLAAKVGKGIRDWRPEFALGQYRLPDCNADLGLPDMTLQEAKDAGVKTMVIGVANRGGVFSETWKEVMVEALEMGFDLASGLHKLLKDDKQLAAVAEKNGRTLFDVRIPQQEYPIATGERRSGKRCLTVGTDCSVGKMYTALAMEKEMKQGGQDVDFRATGQTGILINGEGIPLDAVVADFMAGAIEMITPDNDPDHWDLIEGQGSLFHVSFSGVTLALIHGGQPDALVLCHEPTRGHMRGIPGFQLPTLEAVRDLSLQMAHIVNPDCKVIGISINTASLSEEEAISYMKQVEERMKLPTVDPYRQGAARLVDALGELT
ncbi:MAG: N-acetyltransferase DgcN [Balneolaceae bacterium]